MPRTRNPSKCTASWSIALDRTVQNGISSPVGSFEAWQAVDGHSSQGRSSQQVAGQVLKNFSGFVLVRLKTRMCVPEVELKTAPWRKGKRSAVI